MLHGMEGALSSANCDRFCTACETVFVLDYARFAWFVVVVLVALCWLAFLACARRMWLGLMVLLGSVATPVACDDGGSYCGRMKILTAAASQTKSSENPEI
jgi:hypothetical protein